MDGAFPSQKGQSFSDNLPGGGYGGRGGGPGGPGRGMGGRGGFRGTAENAKTKLCTRWMQGDCRFGDRCNFAHGEQELRKLPDRPDGPPMGGRGYAGRGGRGGGYGYAAGPRGPGGPRPGGRGYGGYPGPYGGPQAGYGGPQAGYGMEAGQQPGYGQAMPDQPRNMNPEEWAAQGYPVAGPNGWYMYRTKDTGEAYFHNHMKGLTQWERPADWPLGSAM